MRSSQKKWIWLLLALAVIFLLVAAAAVVAYLLLLRPPAAVETAWKDPIANVQPAGIAPDLALYPLAGALELETIDAAITNGDLETAYASLVFSLSLSDAQRIGRLILLGGRFAEMEQPERAALCYQQITDLAILSPGLNDPARADALLASGKGWIRLEDQTAALAAYDQVYVIAVHSPYLQKAHRRELFRVLEMLYGDLGQVDAANVARQRIIELDQDPNPRMPAAPIEAPDLPAGEEPVSSPEVGALEETRRQAAFALLQGLSGGGEPAADQVNALAAALQAEDAAKLGLYRQELEATTQPGKRINIQWHLIRWLLLKYQVAKGALGLSIVPDWEAQETEIQSALSTAYEDLLFDYEDLVAGLPDISLVAPGSYQIRRGVTLAGRLGQYPNYPEQQRAEKIREAVASLMAAGFVEQLYVDVEANETGLRFFLNPASQYGTPAQGP